MWVGLEQDIRAAAGLRIKKFELYARAVHDENERRTRRSTKDPLLLELRRPEAWSLGAGFNPYTVRARAKSIAHAITLRLKGDVYTPRRPSGFRVPKHPSGYRTVSTFEIADEVISNRLFSSLMRKNQARLSSHSYAYRADRSPYDAIARIRDEFSHEQRLFVAEYDFSKFFSQISHDYLYKTLDRLGVVRTSLEENLIAGFLAAPAPYLNASERDDTNVQRRTRGLPEGTSASLFLANVAATPIDRALESLGVGFTRYADDTLIWSPSYERITKAAAVLHAAAEEIGAPLNVEKSPGVRLLVPKETRNSEMISIRSVDYLGHTLGLRSVHMRSSAIARIKDRVQNLIFGNLLREPLQGTQSENRLTSTDRDYTTYIWQLRRYLYGPLSENQVRRFQHGTAPDMRFEGVMSFFPLVDHDEELLQLDVWIATQTWLALKKRAELLSPLINSRPTVWGLTKDELIQFQSVSATNGKPVDLRIPSLRRISGVIQSAALTYGFSVAGEGSELYLYE